jgi:hypothetical protein
MSSKTVIPKRALIIGGDIVRLPEYAIQDVQNRIRGTGEKLEDAIERIYVEFLNGDYDDNNDNYKDVTNTINDKNRR